VDIHRVVHYEFVPQGQMLNQCYYTDTLQHLQQNVQQRRHEKWNSGDWFLDHDNAPADSALSVHEFLAKNKITVILNPFYLSDLATCVFYLLPKLKMKEI
jgi:hypothetical protein